ncbi:hypothetical protein D3C74_322070 [compost metagenome]
MLIHGQAAELHSCGLEGMDGIEIGRLLQQYGRAARQKPNRYQLQALKCSGGDQNRVWISLYAVLRQLAAYGPPQPRAAERFFIGQRRQCLPGELSQHTGHGFARQQPGRRLTGAKTDQPLLIFQAVDILYRRQIGIVDAFFDIRIPASGRLDWQHPCPVTR